MSKQRFGMELPGTLQRSPAKALGIAGRSTMGKEELARAIAQKQR